MDWIDISLLTFAAFATSALTAVAGAGGGTILIALMLHHATFASGFFRTAFYLPSVISGVALVTIWSWIYSREYGLLNFMLSLVGIDGPNWLGDPSLAIVAIIIASLWGFGGTMLILLTGLNDAFGSFGRSG